MFPTLVRVLVILFPLRFLNAADKLNVSIVAVGYIAPVAFSSLVYIGPSLSAATEHVQWKYRETINFELTILYDRIHTTFADVIDNSEYIVSEWHYRQRKESDLTVYVVIACANPTDLPYYTAQWNTLLVNTIAECPQIRNRQLYPTWISVNTLSQTYCSELYIELLAKYNWTSTYFVIDTASTPYYVNLANFLLGDLKNVEGTQQTVAKIATTKGLPFKKFGPILERARSVSRVLVFFGLPAYFRELMITAATMNMTNGEYDTEMFLNAMYMQCANSHIKNINVMISGTKLVYIATESMRSKVIGLLHWKYSDSDDQIAFQAFQSVFVIHPRDIDKPPDYNLGPEFVARSRRDYNFTYLLSDQVDNRKPKGYRNHDSTYGIIAWVDVSNAQVDQFLLAYEKIIPVFFTLADTYASITTLGQVLNESLTHREPLEHGGGNTIAKQFLNRTFTDDNGAGTVYINKEGQRRSDFTVSYFSPNGTLEPFMHKIGTSGELVEVIKLKTWGNLSFPPPNEPLCGYMHQNIKCQPQHKDQVLHVYTILPALAGTIIIIGLFSLYYVRYIKHKTEEKLLLTPWWHVTLALIPSPSLYSSPQSMFSSLVRNPLLTESSAKTRWKNDICVERVEDSGLTFSMYQDTPAMMVKLCNRIAPITFRDLSSRVQFLYLMKKFYRVEHLNLVRFFGITITGADVCTVSAVFQCPPRGTFLDICNSFITQDSGFASTVITDYLDGVQYVHSSAFGYHGRLSIMACWIDKHFTLKIANLALDRITTELCRTVENLHEYPVSSVERLYWSTPETPDVNDRPAMQAVDIYSSGLIIYEVLSKGALYRTLCSVQQNDLARYGSNAVMQKTEFTNLTLFEPVLRSCWNSEPTKRPSIRRLRAHMSDISPVFKCGSGRNNLFDKVYNRLCDYSADLECEVAVRTASLRDEMEKCDAITGQFLPRAIIKQMRAGRSVEAELFECVSIMFTDLCGFVSFVKANPPESTIRLIGETEACFDLLSSKCDVYKVEAVGDSYLVASGLPIRVGDNHIKQIATFAIRLMEAETTLEILQDLRFKMGIHSGPCAAGVLGLRRPRYCLFGDTINTASRMCSHGMPGRIHLSPSSTTLLERFPEFVVKLRGVLDIKGKSEMTTYWLSSLMT